MGNLKEKFRLSQTLINENAEPLVLIIEPYGVDYTLLPGEEFELWEEMGADNQPSVANVVYKGNTILVYELGDVEVRSKGIKLECGHQRSYLSKSIHTQFTITFSSKAREVFTGFQNTEVLSKVLEVEVKKTFERFWRYELPHKSVWWTNLIVEDYRKMYLIWRADFFAGTMPDGHLQLHFRDDHLGTELHVVLTGFSEQQTCDLAVKFWKTKLLIPLAQFIDSMP
jgi:hypothetical protein